MAVSTWNPLDQIGMTLSGGNLIATTIDGNIDGIRGTQSNKGNIKVYCEFTAVTAFANNLSRVGFATATWALNASDQLGGANSLGWDPTGNIFYNDISGGIGATEAQNAAGTVVCMALDYGNQLIWVRINGGNWNNSPTANPATGAGGYTIPSGGPFSSSTSIFPAFSMVFVSGSGVQWTGSAPFARSVPSGFTAWDAVNVGIVVGSSIWNPSDNVGLTLSNGNRIATVATSTTSFTSEFSSDFGGGSGVGVRGTKSNTIGKYYGEFTAQSSLQTNLRLGFATLGWNPSIGTSLGGDTTSVAWSPSGQVFLNNLSIGSASATTTSGDVICVAMDITNKKVWFRVNGGNWNNLGTNDPVSGAGGLSLIGMDSGPWFNALGDVGDMGDSVLWTGSGPFAQALPSGYLPWDGVTNSTIWPGLGSLSLPIWRRELVSY